MNAQIMVLGGRLYEDKCLVCHGANGTGRGPISGGMVPSPADFTDDEWTHGGDPASIKESIAESITGSVMAPWKSALTDDEIEALVRYVLEFSRSTAHEQH